MDDQGGRTETPVPKCNGATYGDDAEGLQKHAGLTGYRECDRLGREAGQIEKLIQQEVGRCRVPPLTENPLAEVAATMN